MKLGSRVGLLGLVLFGLLVGPARALFKIQSYLSGTSRVPPTTVRSLRAGVLTYDTSLVDVFVIDLDTKDFAYGFSADRSTKNGTATGDTLPVITIWAIDQGRYIKIKDPVLADSITVPLDTLKNGKVSGLLAFNHTIHDSFAAVIIFPNQRAAWNTAAADCVYNIRSWIQYTR